jgi:hypothetical protein
MLRRHSKVIALFLLLIFSERGSLRLWMHHWFHESKIASASSPDSQNLQLACDCFSEALMPFQESTVFTISVPLQKSIELGDAPQSPAPDTEEVYYSLKGPPAALFCSHSI